MIRKDEIFEVAARLGLQHHIVEKDYVLGWFLAGINQHSSLSKEWIFKGGTCLKKCYFETYRFSEDLDFTVADGVEPPTEASLKAVFEEVAGWVYETSGVEVPAETIEFEVFQNPRGTVSVQGKAAYRGPLRAQTAVRTLPRIKLDLTLDEPIVLPAQLRSVGHPYSDVPQDGIKILAYVYEEVFAEKTRALVQRLRPRDLYDVIHFFRRLDLSPDRMLVRSTLERKCQLRGVQFPTLELIQTHENRQFVESEWETMLAHQVPTLPPFEQFLSELPQVLDWISGAPIVESEALMAEEDFETTSEVVSETSATLGPVVGASNLEKVRFAAANRLLLKLGYGGAFREIEPYSLARSSEGNLLLRAIKAESGESRSYRFDRIESLEVTRQPFTPQYQMEITSSGYLPVHQLTRATRQRSGISRRGIPGGPTYVFQCTSCNKQFRRKSHDGTLKAHKGRGGRSCYGTYGRYLRTEWR